MSATRLIHQPPIGLLNKIQYEVFSSYVVHSVFLCFFGIMCDRFFATVVQTLSRISVTFNLSKVVEPSASKPIEVKLDFSLHAVPSNSSVFHSSDEEFVCRIIFMSPYFVVIKKSFVFFVSSIELYFAIRKMFKIISSFIFSKIMKNSISLID